MPSYVAGPVSVGDSMLPLTTAGSARLRQAEVEHLHRPVFTHLHVGRLEVPMNDPCSCAAERVGDLPGDRQRLGQRAARRRDAGASVAFDQLHDEEACRPLLPRRKYARCSVIERRQHLRFALEPASRSGSP